MSSTRASAPPPGTEELGGPAAVPAAGWRQRVRSNPALYPAYRVGVFIAGLACCAVGVALAVLPGPLTIPPVLLGLWIWSTEFRWAQRLFQSFQKKAREAWAHAKAHPVSSAAITIGGLALAGLAFWAVAHFQLVDKAKSAIGL
ncbi:MAG: PGPGW domain-containing protein [Actinomycetota bacterium]|nr:PGPGW domain-containing protein [Actinomycetota bacterium]